MRVKVHGTRSMYRAPQMFSDIIFAVSSRRARLARALIRLRSLRRCVCPLPVDVDMDVGLSAATAAPLLQGPWVPAAPRALRRRVGRVLGLGLGPHPMLTSGGGGRGVRAHVPVPSQWLQTCPCPGPGPGPEEGHFCPEPCARGRDASCTGPGNVLQNYRDQVKV